MYKQFAEELYEICIKNDAHPNKWLTARELAKLKGGPGLIAKLKKNKGLLSELRPVYFDYVNSITKYQSCNTPDQWACKFDRWLFNEYEFTPKEVDELQTDRIRQIRRETSQEVTS